MQTNHETLLRPNSTSTVKKKKEKQQKYLCEQKVREVEAVSRGSVAQGFSLSSSALSR